MAFLIALTLLLAPAYAVKFDMFGLPTNLLMLWVFFVWLIFAVKIIVKKQIPHFFSTIKKYQAGLLWFGVLFFLAGLVSLFWQDFNQDKLGQFTVVFLQPFSMFLIANFEFRRQPETRRMWLATCYFLLALTSIYSLIQYFTLFGLPPAYWGNSVEPKRALGFFSHPNFYALFAAPLLAFLLPDLGEKIQNWKPGMGHWKFVAAWSLGAFGLLLSLSRAGWLGLGAAALTYLALAADKKLRRRALVILTAILLIIIIVPALRWRVILPLYGEKSAVSRVSLWHTGWKAVNESPLLGLGLTGFAKNWDRLNTDPNIDRHNFPHNIFLNAWVETGIVGLIGLVGLIGTSACYGLKNRKDIYKFGTALFLIALTAQGLIDNPYFKNDLAMVFWLVLSLVI